MSEEIKKLIDQLPNDQEINPDEGLLTPHEKRYQLIKQIAERKQDETTR